MTPTYLYSYITVCALLLSGIHAFVPSPLSNSRSFVASSSSVSPVLKSSSQSQQQPTDNNTSSSSSATNFPVLNRIAGVEWNGVCRYVNSDLKAITNLKLVGGLRYDLDGTICTLSSFLTFPNGNTREVVMRGNRRNTEPFTPMRLDSTAEDGGPIYMILTELGPDTVLINEVEKGSGKIIMTSSLSIVNEGKELVQISHEVGEADKIAIEGHQVWRLKQVPIEYDDFAARDTTGR
jgi:hypothetical protein